MPGEQRCYQCGRRVPDEELTMLTVIEGLSERRRPFHEACAASVQAAKHRRAGLVLLVTLACFALGLLLPVQPGTTRYPSWVSPSASSLS
jgi:hypothetical protein